MKTHIIGLDVLRGIGIFSVLILHTAFYYFDGIYDLDLSEPPLIITLIGFVLMFAGMFAMISGFVHTLQSYRAAKERHQTGKEILKYRLMAGLYVLLIAYLYFLFTGPGLIHFDTRSMDQSLLVELIKSGRFVAPSLERILYVDSLVMIGLNVILVALFVVWGLKLVQDDVKRSYFFYVAGIVVLVLSAIRIPLYATYLNAVDNEQYGLVLLLNFFVNKNNPILPFLSFGLFGSWMATLILYGSTKMTRWFTIFSGILFVVVGLTIYLTAEETMLERQIDYTWYGIMVFQIGLFKLLILLFLRLYKSSTVSSLNPLSRFFYRFGIAGLSVFFIEQVISSLIKQIGIWINPDLYLDLYPSIGIGLVIALVWGVVLIFWQKAQFKYGLEYFYGQWMAKFGGSAKADKLKE
jgi:hypothetical protein